jgi:hypothetical protein
MFVLVFVILEFWRLLKKNCEFKELMVAIGKDINEEIKWNMGALASLYLSNCWKI